MNCEQCEDQLLELLYGELPAQQATLVQSHADDCQACSTALVELQDAMGFANAFEFDDPPPTFDAPIMEAARSHVLREERIAKLNEPQTRDGKERQGASLLDWLRGLMTAPQLVATGAMVAIVGVSIWMLREQTRQGDTAMQVEPAVFPRAVPAEEDKVDDEISATPLFEETTAREASEPSPEALARKEVAQKSAARRGRQLGERARARRSRRAASESGYAKKSKEGAADPWAGLAGGAEQGSRGYAPSSTVTKGRAAPAQALEEAAAPAMAQKGQELADTPEAEDRKTTAYNRGINLYEARKYAEAARAFEQALANRVARRSDTLIYLARSYRERGDCARALKPYEVFIRENPNDGRVSAAKRELRDCRRRIDTSKPSGAKRSKSVDRPTSL